MVSESGMELLNAYCFQIMRWLDGWRPCLEWNTIQTGHGSEGLAVSSLRSQRAGQFIGKQENIYEDQVEKQGTDHTGSEMDVYLNTKGLT